jgi:class 3 adenylate cyclase
MGQGEYTDPAPDQVKLALQRRGGTGSLLRRTFIIALVLVIGFESWVDYAAIGSVANLAVRLCAEARGGQLLISQRVFAAVEALVHAEPLGELSFKRFRQPMPVLNVLGLKKSPDF